MNKTITVKGIGKASTSPDYVILSLGLKAQDKKYDQAMAQAAEQIQQLKNSLFQIGFERDAVKTTDFDVDTEYENVKDSFGNYTKVFKGYTVSHKIKLSFDFDMNSLSRSLSAISACLAHPSIDIQFTVKDATAINEEMLRSAELNARRKAEILCDASGVKLGDLLAVDYNWAELNIYSQTDYRCCDDAMMLAPTCAPCDIQPDDIDVSDTATFTWEIK